MAVIEKGKDLIEIGGVRLEIERRGQGQPLLLLYGEEALELEAPFVDELARDSELIIPSPPGFGASDRPDWITRPGDVASSKSSVWTRWRLSGSRSAAGSRRKWP